MEEIDDRRCLNNHDLVLIDKVELGPLADEQLGFVQLEDQAADDVLQAVCSNCERVITKHFWMCSNLASSIQAASRGEDFLNPCQDVNLICVSCLGGDQVEEVEADANNAEPEDPLEVPVEEADPIKDEAQPTDTAVPEQKEEVKHAEPAVVAEVSGILDFLDDVKPKAAVVKPNFVETQINNADEEEEKAGGDTGGGWGDDEEFDI